MKNIAKLIVVTMSFTMATITLSIPSQSTPPDPTVGPGEPMAKSYQQEQDSEKTAKQDDDDLFSIPVLDENTIARRDFMRTKLMYSQNIFEGLTMGDFDAIDAGIKEVQLVTEGEQWVAIDNDSYRKLTEDFKTSTKRLKAAADSENIEATALRFYEMSTRCIDCHQHIRAAKYDL